LVSIFKARNIKSVTVAIMEVPCCHSLYSTVQAAIEESGKQIKLTRKVVKIKGDIE